MIRNYVKYIDVGGSYSNSKIKPSTSYKRPVATDL